MKTCERQTRKTALFWIRLPPFVAPILTELDEVVDREQDLHLG